MVTKTNSEIEVAIDKYIAKYCIKKMPECTRCMGSSDDVLYDQEASEYYCDHCLSESLKEDVELLFELTDK